MALQIVTGYTGTPHITSAQDRDINQGTFGAGSYILDIGTGLEAVIYSNNTIRIRAGAVCHQGCVGIIATGTRHDVMIANGTQGMKRKDLIVCRYTKNPDTSVESMTLVCIQGTAIASDPAVPAHNEGSIQEGDSPVDMPLYVVNIDGTNITSVDRVADIVRTQKETDDLIGSGTLLTSAQNIIGAVNETYKRTRSNYGKGTHTITERIYGVYGFMGTGGTMYLHIPINVASDVSSVSFTNLVASIRNTSGSYVYTTSANMASLISSAAIPGKQPVIRVVLSSSDFVGTNNTPVAGEITAATMVLA